MKVREIRLLYLLITLVGGIGTDARVNSRAISSSILHARARSAITLIVEYYHELNFLDC